MSLLITGGQSGIDTWALKWGLDHDYRCRVLLALDQKGEIIRQNTKDDTLNDFYTFLKIKLKLKPTRGQIRNTLILILTVIQKM